MEEKTRNNLGKNTSSLLSKFSDYKKRKEEKESKIIVKKQDEIDKILEDIKIDVAQISKDSINQPIKTGVSNNAIQTPNAAVTASLKPEIKEKKKFLDFFKKDKNKDTSNNKTKKIEAHDKNQESDKELLDKKKKKTKITFSHYERRRHLKDYLEKSGYTDKDEELLSQRITAFAIIIVNIMTVYLFYAGIMREDRLFFVIIQVISVWVFIFPAIFVIVWAVFYFVIDFKIYNRRKEVEEVLPDFLQLASANINAGMPIDQALWFAVRPRFGILAKEIEEVAKSTIVGEDLGPALIRFSNKYDSVMLKRTVNLIIEGLDAGGEIGPLLNKISIDIQETRILRKDMAANVTTYVIFISFATLAAAPFLFALSGQLLQIIQSLISNMGSSNSGSGGMSSMSFSSTAITIHDFNIFAIATLTVTSFFSAVIISTIMYGNARDGIKYVPIFIGVSIILFIIASKALSFFLGGIF